MEGSKNSTNNSSAKNTESGNRPGRPRGSKEKGQKKQSSVDKLGQKFLKNFNPEQSEREKRKLNRRLNQGVKKIIVHDDIGTYVQTGDNFCDCLSFDCEGCHFPCPKCLSTKCGHECRNNRKWVYESIEHEGSENVTRNPVLREITEK